MVGDGERWIGETQGNRGVRAGSARQLPLDDDVQGIYAALELEDLPGAGPQIAYQPFPDAARLRWLCILGNGGLEADNGRAPGLRRASPASIVREPASA